MNTPDKAKPGLAGNMLVGALGVGLLTTAGRGLVMAWQDYAQEWGLFSLVWGLLMGPSCLFSDLFMLVTVGRTDFLILPWTVMGGLVGALCGLFMPNAPHQPGETP